ncbi:MAG: hypothetical protein WD690_08440 [Vicinamibacterales bacterium]
MQQRSKRIRLAEFYRRMRKLPAFENHDDAFEGGASLLDALENELTSIPYAPADWRSDGRLYWPQADNAKRIGRTVTRYRSFAHEMLIGDNGSLEIRAIGGDVELSKPGGDGRLVSDLLRDESE